jgi:hypothetical protein
METNHAQKQISPWFPGTPYLPIDTISPFKGVIGLRSNSVFG